MILRAALAILIDEGYQGLSMRQVAARCGLQFGNLTYHYPSREALITELLESVIRGYEVHGLAYLDKQTGSAEFRLTKMFAFGMADIRSRKTTHLFPELWALANHDEFIAGRVQALYTWARSPFEALIAEIRPDLPPTGCTALAVLMSATMEGLTIFAGHGKPFEEWLPTFTRMACKAFLNLIRTIAMEDLIELAPLATSAPPVTPAGH